VDLFNTPLACGNPPLPFVPRLYHRIAVYFSQFHFPFFNLQAPLLAQFLGRCCYRSPPQGQLLNTSHTRPSLLRIITIFFACMTPTIPFFAPPRPFCAVRNTHYFESPSSLSEPTCYSDHPPSFFYRTVPLIGLVALLLFLGRLFSLPSSLPAVCWHTPGPLNVSAQTL